MFFALGWILAQLIGANLGNPIVTYTEVNPNPKLIIIAFDGLRWDFVNQQRMPHLAALARDGVLAKDGILNQEPTVTTPNFETISTGLYVENHGIVGNSMYDLDTGDYFNYWDFNPFEVHNHSLEAKWYNGEPIWTTNQNAAGHFSGSIHWPTSDARRPGIPVHLKPLKDDGPQNFSAWKADWDLLLSWFLTEEPKINLGMYYIDAPDESEHASTIFSQEVSNMTTQLDHFVKYIVDSLKRTGLYKQMNLIFLADHGHANYYTPVDEVDIGAAFAGYKDVRYSGNSLVVFDKDKEVDYDAIYDKLEIIRQNRPAFYLWKTSEMPEKYHYKRGKRLGPIVVEPYLGYTLTLSVSNNTDTNCSQVKSAHGWLPDYKEMHPFFVAHGPAFRKGYTFGAEYEVQNVDVYALACSILGVQPAPNDGSLRRVKHMLKSWEENSVKWKQSLTNNIDDANRVDF